MPNQDYINRVYQTLTDNIDGFTKTPEEFTNLMTSDPSYRSKVYATLTETIDGFTKSPEEFNLAVGSAEPVKKKEQSIPSEGLPGLVSPLEEGGMASTLPNFSSGFTKPSSPQVSIEQQTPAEAPAQQPQVVTPIQQQPAQRTEFVTKATPEEEYKAPVVQSFAKQMKEEGIRKEKPQDDFFNDSIQFVNKDLIGKTADEVANSLQYHFGDYGFNFYSTGESDQVIAKSKNGQEIKLPTDALFDSSNQDIADKMKDFLRQNRVESERLKTIESGAIQKEKKIINQDDIKQRVTSLDDETQAFNSDVKLYLQAKALYDQEKNKYINLTPDQLSADPQLKADYDAFVTNRKRLSEIGGNIAQKEQELKYKSNALESAVGKYTASKASTGTWSGALWNSIVGGVTDIVGGIADIGSDIYYTNKPLDVNSKEYRDSFIKAAKQKGIEMPEGQSFDTFYKSNFANIQSIESQMRDNMKKEAKYGIEGKISNIENVKSTLQNYLGDEGTTPEYINKLEQNIVGRSVLGLARYAPAMVAAAYSGNAGFLTAALTAHDNVMEQMNADPDFKNVSEDEKNAFAAPYDIVNGLLMSNGFTKAATQSSFTSGLIARALNKMTKGATAKTFEELVARDIQNWAAKRVLTVADGFISGAETGAEMAVFDLSMKDLYNQYKDKEMFNTPLSNEKLTDEQKAKEYAKVVGESALVMGIGGGILSIPKAMNVYQLYPVMENYRGRLIDNGTFEIFEQTTKDPEYQRMFKVDYQNKVNQGLIPFEQAKKEYDNYVQLKGLLQSVDPSLTTEQRKEALAILQEKQQLEKDIAGKDPNQGTIKAKQERIAKLNDMLSNIATPQYTIEGKSLDKQEFIDKINSMGKEELSTLNANVKNDQEVQKLLENKLQEYAIQEPSTKTGVLRTEQPELELPKVGEGNAQEQAITTTGKPETVTPAKEGEVNKFIIEPNERTSWFKGNKEYKVGDIIDGNQLDELSGGLVGNAPNEKFVLVQEPLSKFDDSREKLLAQEKGYEKEEIDRLESMKSNFDKTPPLPNEGDGMHRIISAKELGHKTILMWKNIKDVETALEKPEQVTPAKEGEVTPELEKEIADLEAILGPPPGQPKFRLSEGEEEPISESDVERITEEMNKMAPVELNFTVPIDTRGEIIVSPASESNAVEKLNPEEADKITKNIQEFNGIPMVTGMSDILATGTVKDSQGNPLTVNGGILFNVLDPANKGLAWAGVSEDGAKEQYDNAVALYNSNKELFDRLWKEGKLPNGQVPMAIMRMSDSALNSNEAVFRWILPTIEKLPEENRKNALDAFANAMERQLNTLDSKKAQNVIDFIKDKKITTLDGLIKEVINDAELRSKDDPKSKLALDRRSFIYDAIFADPGTKTASKPTVKALLEGTGKEYNNQFLSDTVYKELGEPSMLKTGQGDVVSIVGIDVLNGGVEKATHGNYGFGPKGGIIALIRNPKHGIDVFPEWKAKTARVFKPNKRGEYPAESEVSQQTGGAFFIDKAFRGAKPTVGEMTDLDVLIGKLRFAFPSVQVAKTPEEFNSIINRDDVRKRISNGKTILGVTVDGKIYLNPDYQSLNTPIHEFGHIWIDFLKSEASGEKGTKLLNKGYELIRGTEAHKKAIKKYGDTELALEEALVEEIGAKGNNIADAAKRSKFKSWMNAMFKYIKEKFTSFKNLKIKDITNLSLDDFINISLADLFSGKEVSPEFKPETTEASARARFEAVDNIKDIIKIAKENKFSDEAIKKVLEKRGFSAEEINTALKESFKSIEGYDRLQNEIVNVVSKSEQRGATPEKTLQNVIDYVQTSAVYERANDVQREQIIREIRSQFGLKEKAAPSTNKILGTVKDVTKVTMTEKTALKKQIKDLARGARDAKQAWTKVSDELTKELNELVKNGNLSTSQVKSIVNKLGKLNMFNEEAVSRFVGYMDKVFQDAEYSDKLNTANGLKKTIKKISKNKDKDVNLTKLGKEFSKIDPSLVDDIDAYNAIGEKIKESIKGSSLKPRGVKLADMVNVEDAMLYIKDTMNKQREELAKIKAQEIKDILNVNVSDLTYDEMLQMIDSDEPITKNNEVIIRDTIKKYFDGYSAIAEKMIVSGKDVFTGEELEFTSKQKELIKKFMDMDLNDLSLKDSLSAVDALNNFTQNYSTAKMATTVAKYEGAKNAKKLADKNIKATPLSTYMLKSVGRAFGEQVTTLPVLMETMFSGYNRGALVRKEMGLTELINKKAQAEYKANKIVEEYVDKFYDRKANGEIFNSEDNMTERGVIAFTTRNVIGTPEEMQNEFNRRKGLIEQSIDVLRDGSELEQKKAEMYQKAYDKLLDGSKNANEVRGKADPNNVEAVDWWIEKWADEYDDLADVSEAIYNKILDKDSGYTTDKYVRLEGVEKEKEELTNEQSAYLKNSNTVYKKSSGVLMETTKPELLPKNKSGETLMYVDLSFDNINANSLYDALMDMNTAAPIRQVEAFYESKDFKKIIPSLEDREMLKKRIKSYIRDSRDKNIVDSDELNNILRKLNKITTIGVGQALGGVTQSVKQVVPIAVNTFLNAGGLNISNLYNKDVMDFIDNSGRSIANRGALSQVQIETLNRLVDKVDKSRGEKMVDAVEKLQNWWLETFLVRPDVFIARASWLTYYEKYLKDHDIVSDPSQIDYSTHKLNEDAADYAQDMVDRQQNISDHDLGGAFLTTKEPLRNVIKQTSMPFASFRMNQIMRMHSDWSILKNPTSTSEDRKIAARSLGGAVGETLMFKLIQWGLSVGIVSLMLYLMGEDESEADFKKRMSNSFKGQVTGAVTDYLSPLPLTDRPIQFVSNYVIDKAQAAAGIADSNRINIFDGSKSDVFSNLGTLGITGKRASDIYDIGKLALTGEYEDDYGNKKMITKNQQRKLRALTAVSIIGNQGALPNETNTAINGYVKYVKKNAKTQKQLDKAQGITTEGSSSMSEEDVKKHFPETYQRYYSKESPYKQIEERYKEIEKQYKK